MVRRGSSVRVRLRASPVPRKRDIKQFRQACKEAGLVLRSMRGPIVDARIAYPDVLHVDIRDAAGGLWRLATQDAEWSPSDPTALVGRSIEDAEIDEHTGDLRCKLSDGSVLDLRPAAREAADDPPNWELITPDDLVLEFGPGMRWQIGSADVMASAR
jgi:hypothetical protein